MQRAKGNDSPRQKGKDNTEPAEEDKEQFLCDEVNEPIINDGKGWKTDLFACHLDCVICLRVCCCCPLALADVKTNYDETAFLLNLICSLCGPLTQSIYARHLIRTGYKINGTWLQDILVGCCCACCSACQLQREVAERGKITSGGPIQMVMKT